MHIITPRLIKQAGIGVGSKGEGGGSKEGKRCEAGAKWEEGDGREGVRDSADEMSRAVRVYQQGDGG